MSATTRVVIRGGNGLRMAVDLPDAGSPVDAVTWALESFKQFDASYEPDKLVIVAQVVEPDPPAINAEPPPPPKDPGKAMA